MKNTCVSVNKINDNLVDNVTDTMKTKVNSGVKKRKHLLPFRNVVFTPTLRELKTTNPQDFYLRSKDAVKIIGKKNVKIPRVISIPKRGGFLIPLLSGLAALGGLFGAGANIAKVVKEVHAAKDQLAEAVRHNRTLESIAIGKKGSGLFVKPYRKGYGLFIQRKKKKTPKSKFQVNR